MLVIVESPFMYKSENIDERLIGQIRNITYARLAMNDCIQRGESPYASHLLLTQPFILDDDNPKERQLGIDAGLDWGDKADKSVFYTDLGISSGMKYGELRAKSNQRIIENRTIDGWEYALDENPNETLMRLELYTSKQLESLLNSYKTFNGLDSEIIFKPY